ncbi:Nucleotidyl transferase [Dethiosulfovibrio peptidovorans DSM 11002]|uniref:UTP--glucose-1-phosphate uridylyltransferase n=1 Tax=Dethiosulfovibrio peptidovorans DSM 11002 TaxID=469381 RepID=D2Z2S6_9BACT|nr:UTP--glucose-1-phosphate uridylyltransferase [Dethiosulfovibrio peptidovorans]EFC92089.1 Nucleotidyl transferase [Dethiosulfovibrio peptidovorans DSM 11002]
MTHLECIFPVAGLGTRFLPATKEIPKEMVPLLDRPVIHYGVDEARNSGCSRMIMVTGRSKGCLEDYFDRSWELERILESRGKERLLDAVRETSSMGDILSVRQSAPLGLGHAVLCGEPLCNGEFFSVILPDDVMEGQPPVLRQLMDVHDTLGGSVLALEEVSDAEVSRYGMVAVEPSGTEGIFRITDMVEKPSAADSPSRLAVMGRYVLSRRIFDLLKSQPKGAGGEYQLTDGIKALIDEEPVWGVVYKGERYDCGTLEGWLDATIRMACRRKDLAGVVEKAISSAGK